MKVLQVNVVYKKGSTGKITHDLHAGLLNAGMDSIVCYGRGALIKEPGVYKVCPEWYAKLNNALSRVTGIMYGGCFFSTNNLISIIKREKPDIVHLQCINGYFVNIYRLVTWLKRNKIKTVLTLHAEFMYTGGCAYSIDCNQWSTHTGCGHPGCPRWHSETKSIFFDRTGTMWKRMKKAFDGFEELRVVAVSKWIEGRAMQSGILGSADFQTLYNGIQTETFSHAVSQESVRLLRKKYGIPEDKKIVLHVTPSFESTVKGGIYFRKLAEMLPDNYRCVVVGAKKEENQKLITIPFVKEQKDLAGIYKLANVMVITSLSDNYPTVCLEANCCGTPVVGFDVGGVSETIFPGMGETVAFGDIQGLCNITRRYADSKGEISEDTVHMARYRNSCGRMVKEYLQLYENFLDAFN